jgi:hypothetical protein
MADVAMTTNTLAMIVKTTATRAPQHQLNHSLLVVLLMVVKLNDNW